MAEEKIGNGDALLNAMQDFLREMTEEVIRMSADLDMADPDAEAKARRIGEIRATKKHMQTLANLISRALDMREIEEE